MGELVGIAVGCLVGEEVGDDVGAAVGALVGTFVGCCVVGADEVSRRCTFVSAATGASAAASIGVCELVWVAPLLLPSLVLWTALRASAALSLRRWLLLLLLLL